MEDFNDPTQDPKNYKLGILYVNKADSRVFVPKRYGVGFTLNFGKRYVTIGFLLILAIILYTAIFR